MSDSNLCYILTQVDNVINRMGLRAVADSRIGGAVVRGLSGGEKRRVTIAVQLLQDPGETIWRISDYSVYLRLYDVSQSHH